mgnify:CR=1 FL=1
MVSFATDAEISEAFSVEGLLGSLYEEYEPREEQREMALAVNRALATSRNLAVEAGTGVGKSMAYLVPLALAAQKNGITLIAVVLQGTSGTTTTEPQRPMHCWISWFIRSCLFFRRLSVSRTLL